MHFCYFIILRKQLQRMQIINIFVLKLIFSDSAYYYGNNDGPPIPALQHSNTLLVGGNNSENLNLNGLQSTISAHEIRSPLAATRANSSASAASPTGSACAATSASN